MDHKRLLNNVDFSNSKRLCFNFDCEMESALSRGRTISLITNHYRLNVSPITVYHFNVDIKDGPPLQTFASSASCCQDPASSCPLQTPSTDLSRRQRPHFPRSQSCRSERRSKFPTNATEVIQELIRRHQNENGIFFDRLRRKR